MTVRVLAVGDPAVDAYANEDFGVIESFHERTGITVAFDVVPWDNYLPTLARAVGSTHPDYDIVMIAGHLWIAEYVERGYLRPLTDEPALNSGDYDVEDILASVRSEMMYRGQQYLVPSFSDGHLLYSRVDPDPVQTAEGLADPTRFAEWARSIRSDSHAAPMVVKASPTEAFLDWLPYLRAFGGEAFEADGSPAFTTSAGFESLAYYASLRDHCSLQHAPFGNAEVAGALTSGHVAFGVSWGGQAGVIVPPGDRSFAFATLTRPWNVTWAFGVLSNATNPAPAVDLLAYLSGREVDRIVGRVAGSPSRASTYADAPLQQACPWFPAQLALLERAEPLPSLPDLSARIGPLYQAVAETFTGESSAQSALNRAADTIVKL